MPETVDGLDDVHLIDAELMGIPAAFAVYVIDADRVAVVDAGAGDGVRPVLDGLDALGIAPADVDVIVLTHAHVDHAGGAPGLLDACPDARVACPKEAIPHLTDPDKLETILDRYGRAMGASKGDFGDVEPLPRDRVDPIEGGDVLDLGDRDLEVHAAPGHVRHQVALLETATRGLFVADEAGLAMMGRLHPTCPPPQFDLEATLDSLDRFSELAPSVLLFSHFGPRHDVQATLEEYADVIRDFVEDVDRVRGDHDGVPAMVEDLEARWSTPTIRTDVLGALAYLGDERWRDYPGGRQT